MATVITIPVPILCGHTDRNKQPLMTSLSFTYFNLMQSYTTDNIYRLIAYILATLWLYLPPQFISIFCGPPDRLAFIGQLHIHTSLLFHFKSIHFPSSLTHLSAFASYSSTSLATISPFSMYSKICRTRIGGLSCFACQSTISLLSMINAGL